MFKKGTLHLIMAKEVPEQGVPNSELLEVLYVAQLGNKKEIKTVDEIFQLLRAPMQTTGLRPVMPGPR